MKRKQLEKEAKREEILSTARKIFSEKGFENTSMEEIAKKVKIAKGTIYLYFDSKYDLFAAIINYARENMLHKTQQLQETSLSNLQKIRELINIYLDFTSEYPEYLLIFHSIHHLMKEEDRKKLRETFNEKEFSDGIKIISDILREGVESGEFRADLNIPRETFTVYCLFMSFGALSNFIKTTPFLEVIEGQKIDRYAILWDTVDKLLSFYIKK